MGFSLIPLVFICSYEFIYQQVITASGRPVKLADQEASNGVIHEVGGVLFPPPGTVTAVVAKCPVFSTLFKAVGIAGLGDLLDGKYRCIALSQKKQYFSMLFLEKQFKKKQFQKFSAKPVLR